MRNLTVSFLIVLFVLSNHKKCRILVVKKMFLSLLTKPPIILGFIYDLESIVCVTSSYISYTAFHIICDLSEHINLYSALMLQG